MSDMQPSITRGKKLSAVWIIPLVALLVGISMIVHSYMTEGPTITIEFETAAGREPGKNKEKMLNVDVGLLESVAVKEDLTGVIATVKLYEDKRPLLREDARYWIVRPRVGVGGVSGLETIMGGIYIGVTPGQRARERRAFVGLETPPLTPADAPGLRVTLRSKSTGSIKVGNPVLHKGYQVGRVEAMAFNTAERQASYEIFIDAPFHQLVDSATRFWNASGISIEATTQGVEFHAGSLDSVLLGGITFDTPPGLPAGAPVDNGEEFQLFDSYEDILESPYHHGTHYVVLFEQSLGGLAAGAAVEYRGVPVGRVERILLKEFAQIVVSGGDAAIPVLIYVEPGRLELSDNQQAVTQFHQLIKHGVASKGLRATLETANLLTGNQRVSLDYFPGEPPAKLQKFNEYAVIPSITAGVVGLENRLTVFLDMLNQLPVTETLVEANSVLVRADQTLESLNMLLADDQSQALPAELASTLTEMRNFLVDLSPDSRMSDGLGASVNELNIGLERLNALIRTLSIKPNAVLFPAAPVADPIPQAHSR